MQARSLSFARNVSKIKNLQQMPLQQQLLLKQVGRRNFNNRIDSALYKFIGMLPSQNIGYLLVGLNSFFYFLYLIWPRNQMFSYLNNFTFSSFNLSRGYFQTLFTCHFIHMSTLNYILDSGILYLFCRNISMMNGPLFCLKTILLSIAVGSIFLCAQHSIGFQIPFYGNDAILRGLIFSIIFQNPQAQFYMLPLPVQIPAWFIAFVIFGLDVFSRNFSGLGGTTAAYLMVNYLF